MKNKLFDLKYRKNIYDVNDFYDYNSSGVNYIAYLKYICRFDLFFAGKSRKINHNNFGIKLVIIKK